ncbi:putative short-chain dehydrogenases/reductase [Cantharellus anzutake]|uniref:putative short-chain dehydrogenases/reductase n=1 Tax=Cantharellus anzutake TaxID=1750568 RepID=UPI0019045BA6|nr:putative short-chain dehydrogenases/reductase [Cantharellus anzutake]KAF8322816.1 putative short-chain dehydrogenases/reductase [Cantharellus anzutake]
MPSWFITGTSRGLGLEFVKELIKDPSNVVIATARDISAPGLAALPKSDRLHLLTLDVSKEEHFVRVVAETEKLLPNGLDYLINNAGVDYQTNQTFGNDVDFKAFHEEFEINVIAPLRLTRVLTPLINKGTAKRVAFLTSEMGSITAAIGIPFLGDTYSTTKAALNMAVRKYGAALKTVGSDIILLSIYPVTGYIPGTELANRLVPYFDKYAPSYPRTPIDEGVLGTLKVIKESTKEDHAKFLSHKHTDIAW